VWIIELLRRPLIELYYMLTMGQYVHASIVIFWQPKQSDFIEMMVPLFDYCYACRDHLDAQFDA